MSTCARPRDRLRPRRACVRAATTRPSRSRISRAGNCDAANQALVVGARPAEPRGARSWGEFCRRCAVAPSGGPARDAASADCAPVRPDALPPASPDGAPRLPQMARFFQAFASPPASKRRTRPARRPGGDVNPRWRARRAERGGAGCGGGRGLKARGKAARQGARGLGPADQSSARSAHLARHRRRREGVGRFAGRGPRTRDSRSGWRARGRARERRDSRSRKARPCRTDISHQP